MEAKSQRQEMKTADRISYPLSLFHLVIILDIANNDTVNILTHGLKVKGVSEGVVPRFGDEIGPVSWERPRAGATRTVLGKGKGKGKVGVGVDEDGDGKGAEDVDVDVDDDEIFYAIVGSPNVRGIAWMLIERKKEFGTKRIERVTVFGREDTHGVYNLAVEIEDVDDIEEWESGEEVEE
ncbi:hypothetical protein K402DRAFT_464789 [Aulographum hederae CBS 113979]|uniref:Uncharacterized protein n=1 Tax=Aulographum hederae CBS 113979 TaxID=1176131 RepID=A0A6G1GV35_9PEZI|nr:hypothetical protein K402DRAFT_464789 [Aulographum hederae CBS 113979]